MNIMGQNFANSITGNIPKAILCVGTMQMQVQYNPSSIQISSRAGTQMQHAGGNLGGASDNQIIQMVHPAYTTMNMELIFDDMNPQDAFMLENIAPTVGNVISAGANIIKKVSEKEYSVQTQIDGLMALLTQDETREIMFHWANMSFRGRLESISSRYTMFNKHGNPIRGVVDLSICQGKDHMDADEQKKKGAQDYEKQYWSEAFQKAFGSDKEKSKLETLLNPIEKAVIIIRTEESTTSDVPEGAEENTVSNKELLRLKPVPMDKTAPERGSTFGLNSMAKALNSVSNAVLETMPTQTVSQLQEKRFYVQFNPNELSISGYGGGMVQKMDYTNGGGISFERAKAQISLSVKLVFDKMDVQDAFMADKFNTSPTAIAKGVVKAIKKEKDYSVQTEVEGFIAALYFSQVRDITFAWGNMNYTGVLNGVSAQYTMFNVQGVPIRAEVSLSMLCVDESVNAQSMGTWEKHYKNAFGQGDSSYVKAAQKAGNLLNFNL